ncbi:MAG: M15 family metallopeptidase [Pseudomonadota bacterium]
MLTTRILAASLAVGLFPPLASADCNARDFLTLPLANDAARPDFVEALEIAYPGVRVDAALDSISVGGTEIPVGPDSERSMAQRITDGTIRDQFEIVYPLDFDLSLRREPWFDPGRVRNDTMFRALYGATERQVAASLTRAEYRGLTASTRFAASSRFCVTQQLQAALDAIAAEGPHMDVFFKNVGGSFNWRVIAGTDRLSAHSFGIAVDFNTRLGGYWRWDNQIEGQVGDYANVYPQELVQHMERFGFIWGGKWHHYDGMHFEYRPELILHSRLRAMR